MKKFQYFFTLGILGLLFLGCPQDVKHTVKFDTDGGTQIADVLVSDGQTVNKPNNPTKEGYTFINWYLNDVEYDFSLPVTEDIALKAKWKVLENEDEKPNTDDKTPENQDKPVNNPGKKIHGLAVDKSVTVTINGQTYIIELDAETGKASLTKAIARKARDAEDDELLEKDPTAEEIEAEFEFYNDRLSLKIEDEDQEIFEDEASEDDALYCTFLVEDIDAENPAADADSIKTCNDSDMDVEDSNADAKVDFETQSFINDKLCNLDTLPERKGTNPFLGKKIYGCLSDAGFLRDIEYGEFYGEVTEDIFYMYGEKEYSYQIVQEDDEYILGFIFLRNKLPFETDTLQEACSSVENFTNYLEVLSVATYEFEFPGLKIDSAIGKYKSVQKYLRAYYGLSADCEDDEVIQTYLRNRIEFFRRQNLIETSAFWLKKDNGRFNFVTTSEPGLSMQDWRNQNKGYSVRYLSDGIDVFVGSTMLFFLDSQPLVVDLTDDTITYVDTTGDLPVRHSIKYTELVYAPDYTGLYKPLNNGQQEPMDEGFSCYMTCEDIFGDSEPHLMRSTISWSASSFVFGPETIEE